MSHHEIIIVGGGTAGLTVASLLCKQPNPPDVVIIDPSKKHYYQPIWTLVGAGVFDREISEREEADYIPSGATWIPESVASFQPDKNQVTLSNGESLSYDVLVVAAGIQINWDGIPGLKESVGKPGTGICSNYSYETVSSTWENIRNLKNGVAIFTHGAGAIKCGGAPMKIAFLAADYWRKQNLSKQITIKYIKGGRAIFGVKKYIKPLQNVADRYHIERIWRSELVEIKASEKVATFKNLDSGEQFVESYDMMHVTPPQGPPEFIKSSPLASDQGWVEVDKFTTQHVRYPNVFALGDCSNLPTSKTGAAIRKQAPTTVANILAFQMGRTLPKKYDGYTSCPIVTGYGKLIMAEFDYDHEPAESFPFDQAQERYSMYALKAYGLPQLYWNGMLRGREF